jgi:hypothetical protein
LGIAKGTDRVPSASAFEDTHSWSGDELQIPLLLARRLLQSNEPVELRKTKRYRLRASASFSWKSPSGETIRGLGYTRDISPSGVFVLTNDLVPSGTAVTLEVALPSLRGQTPGAFLRTVGHVVRRERAGFAAVADMGFRMQVTDSMRNAFSKSGVESRAKNEANGQQYDQADPVSRFWM